MLLTDGSRDPECDVQIRRRLTDELSVYSVELFAIIVALQWVEDVQPVRIIVCLDSEGNYRPVGQKSFETRCN
jgi:ribonuclease HI